MKALCSCIIAVTMLAGTLAGCDRREPDESTVFVSATVDGPRAWAHDTFDAADSKFTFAVFSDLTGGERPGVFDIAVEQLNLLRPELIMNVGDLIEGDSTDAAGLNEEWGTFDSRSGRAIAPVFYTGGNHDLTGDLLREVWNDRYGPHYYHFIYKNVLFLVLDTEDNTPERMQEIFEARRQALAVFAAEGEEAFAKTEYGMMPERMAGTIGDVQAAYFRSVISENPEVRWTFLFIHKPAWERDGEANFASIEAALSDQPYTVFHGHAHSYAYVERLGRDYIRLGTTGGAQFIGKNRSMDHVTLVTVDDDGVDIANLLLNGILDKTGHVPLDGDDVCFEKAVCGDRAD